MRVEKDKKTIGLYCKVDESTYADLQAIMNSHGFESLAQGIRWSIRQTARIEKQEKTNEVLRNV